MEVTAPPGLEGHTFDITLMRGNGMFRAECSCGLWEDVFSLQMARQWCANHKRALKPKKGRRT